jgi:hypothetical protein
VSASGEALNALFSTEHCNFHQYYSQSGYSVLRIETAPRAAQESTTTCPEIAAKESAAKKNANLE